MLFISYDSALTLTISVLFDGSDMYVGSLDREGLRRRRHSKTACFTFLSACSTFITSIQFNVAGFSPGFSNIRSFSRKKRHGFNHQFFQWMCILCMVTLVVFRFGPTWLVDWPICGPERTLSWLAFCNALCEGITSGTIFYFVAFYLVLLDDL